MVKSQDVKKAILEGESLFVEFKRHFPEPQSLAGEIVALANTEGGIIVIGVDDEGGVQGIEEARGLEEKVMNIARTNIEPALSVNFLICEVQNKKVVGIKVPKSSSRPHKTNQGKYYIRVGTTKRFPSQEELGRIYQNRGLVYFDTKPIEQTSIRDIDRDKVNDYFRQVYKRDIYASPEGPEQLMNNLDVFTEQEDKLYPTVAGLLFFGKNPQQYLKGAAIKLVHLKGKDLDSDIIQKKDIEGNLPQQIESAVNFLHSSMKKKTTMKNIKREEVLQFPLSAVREVVVNAVAHRDYSISGQKIRIFLFENRLEVTSPGRLPNTITLENIAYKQASRNPAIVRFLDRLGYLEEAGLGIYRVIQDMKKHNLHPPEFKIIDEEFKVTLKE